jgi:hypothetical protein
MIRKYFVVASYEWKALWARGISDGLAINCDTNVLIAIQYSIYVWQILPSQVLQTDA